MVIEEYAEQNYEVEEYAKQDYEHENYAEHGKKNLPILLHLHCQNLPLCSVVP